MVVTAMRTTGPDKLSLSLLFSRLAMKAGRFTLSGLHLQVKITTFVNRYPICLNFVMIEFFPDERA
jgi:hypothetical protein